jgi:hypothetical protein
MARFLYSWYKPLMGVWPPDRGRMGRRVLGLLPVIAVLIILTVLLTLASFDVVGIWVFFYVILGFSWLSAGCFLYEWALDLQWVYDLVFLDNRAAIAPAAGGFVGLSLIYAGANVGDGPGWWVVFIAGGLGLVAWLILAAILNVAGRLSERITVERDVGCGVRFGAFLIASGLILARASGGDWTSFRATIIEFGAGWPVIPLAVLALIVELTTRLYSHRALADGDETTRAGAGVGLSVLCGILYICCAVAALFIMPPLPENPLFGAAG